MHCILLEFISYIYTFSMLFFFFLFNSFSHWTLPPVIQSLPPSWHGSSWRRNVQSGTVFSLFLPSPESSSLPDRHFSSARMFMALRATTRTTSRGLLLHLEVIWFIQTFTLSILLRILFVDHGNQGNWTTFGWEGGVQNEWRTNGYVVDKMNSIWKSRPNETGNILAKTWHKT